MCHTAESLTGLTCLGALCALGLAACGAGGQALDEDSPDAQAYIYRHSLMEVLDYEARIVGDMARGEMPADEQKFETTASNVATLSAMVPDAFAAMSTVPISRAKPEIWQNFDDFQTRAQALQDAAQALAESAQHGGVEASRDTAQQLGRTCGGCHQPFRKPRAE